MSNWLVAAWISRQFSDDERMTQATTSDNVTCSEAVWRTKTWISPALPGWTNHVSIKINVLSVETLAISSRLSLCFCFSCTSKFLCAGGHGSKLGIKVSTALAVAITSDT